MLLEELHRQKYRSVCIPSQGHGYLGSVRILTWNCNGGDYAARAPHLEPYRADVQVLSEVLEFHGVHSD